MAGVLNLLTLNEIYERTRVQAVKDTEKGVLEYYRDLAESMLNAESLDSSKTGYSLNVGYAVLKMVEYLIINDLEHILMAGVGPFESERMGSYQYKVKRFIEAGYPDRVERIIKKYKLVSEPEKLIITSRVFQEFIHDTATGFRPYHDHLHEEFKGEEVEVP